MRHSSNMSSTLGSTLGGTLGSTPAGSSGATASSTSGGSTNGGSGVLPPEENFYATTEIVNVSIPILSIIEKTGRIFPLQIEYININSTVLFVDLMALYFIKYQANALIVSSFENCVNFLFFISHIEVIPLIYS